MRKYAFLITVLLFVVLSSCTQKSEIAFPDADVDYTLRIVSESTASDPVVLSVSRRGVRTEARIVSPEPLSTVSVTVDNGCVTLRSGSCEIPLTEDAGSGIRSIFDTVCRPDNGLKVSPDGTLSFRFDLTDRGVVRHCEITDFRSAQK